MFSGEDGAPETLDDADMKVHSDEEIASIVDYVLQDYDKSGDGYIDYAEFVSAQRKAQGGDNGQ